MNKREKNVILITLFVLNIMIFSMIDVDAKVINPNIKASYDKKADGTSTTQRSLTETEKDNACKTKLGITIDVTDYSRDADYDGANISHNDVAARKVTVKANKGTGKYVIQIYIAKVGQLDKLEKLSDATKVKASDVTEDDIDSTFEDVGDNDTVYYRRTFDSANTDTYTGVKDIQPGYEALIVVMNKKKKDSDEFVTGDCAEISDNKCVKWNKYTITCPKGNIVEKDSTVEELVIKGNAASIYVQNPDEYNLVQNYRAAGASDGDACNNALNGIHSENSEYNVSNINAKYPSGTDWSQYYNKILGDYCSQSQVAYNLKNSKLQTISNKLLKSYYYIRKIENSSTADYETIYKKITEELIPQLGQENVFTDKSQLSIDLNCNYGNENVDYLNNHSKSYLYYETNPETATIFNGMKSNGEKDYKTINVCSTVCYEKMTVDYSPPKTVKAGLCFDYKVTIKSEMECGVNPGTDAIMEIQKRAMCSPQPICGNNDESTQGGPNEDFDACIQNCDNGKYSQKCINSCYKKVYGNSEDNDKTTKKNNDSDNVKKTSKNLINTEKEEDKDALEMAVNTVKSNVSASITKLGIYGNYKFQDSDLENYYKNSKVNNIKYSGGTINCNTDSIINYVHNNNDTKLNICANFFTEAKILKPMGEYKLNNDTKRFKWKKNSTFDDYEPKYDEGNIPKQLGVASPFYLRDADATKQLLIDLVCPEGKNCNEDEIYNNQGYYRKYSIMGNGIKRQYSGRFQCDEKCYYTGCNKKSALTSDDYTETIINDLDAINDKLKACSTTSACEKKAKETTFTISATNERRNNTRIVNKTAETKMGSTTSPSSSDNAMMFVPADNDTDTDTGILGLCYDKRQNPHYQTTITFPGVWINNKTGALSYDRPSEYSDDVPGKYILKKQEYCTAFDSKDVNVDWWKWVEENNSDTNSYPQNFVPNWNITADLGSGDKRFGEYKWSVNFRCFYAMNNKGTNINNNNFKIVDNSKLLKTQTIENKVGFNWTKEAQIVSILKNVNSTESAQTYAINPEKYKEYVQKNGDSIYESKVYDYHIYLSRDNLKAIKNYIQNKKNTYTEFPGNHYIETGVDGLRAYKSVTILNNSKYVTLMGDDIREQNIGINNNYGAELGGLLLNE